MLNKKKRLLWWVKSSTNSLLFNSQKRICLNITLFFNYTIIHNVFYFWFIMGILYLLECIILNNWAVHYAISCALNMPRYAFGLNNGYVFKIKWVRQRIGASFQVSCMRNLCSFLSHTPKTPECSCNRPSFPIRH